MEKSMIEVKLAITAFFTAISAFLGWQGVMAVVWVITMAIDYITGTAAAMKNGEWCSATARQGLWHKGGMLVVVIVAFIADCVLSVICEHLPVGITWTSILLPLVLAWYIVTELGSILENAVKMGAAVPGWMVKMLKIGLKAIDEVGEKIETDLSGEEKEDKLQE
ncbi:MAG: phage holin family protein [Oscillospiraceae bacterium]|nr:phage holin family protein [Oscillospiraceae bacterium]